MTAPLDVAIVGVPKCGTTSVFDWVTSHPEVQGSSPKETYYFVDAPYSDARPDTFADGGWGGFERFFDGPAAGRKRVEASAINLFQRTARVEFARLDPQPLVVVTLRCPVEQIRSAFFFHQDATRISPDLSFAAYLEATLARDFDVFRRTMPYVDVREFLWLSLEWNRYVDWLEPWSDDFADDRLSIVTLDEMAADPVGIVADLHARMSLPPLPFSRADFTASNVTSTAHLRRPGMVARSARTVLPRGRARDRLAAWDRARRAKPSPPLDSHELALLDELAQRFRASDQALAERYGVDVSRWWSSKVAAGSAERR